MSQQLPSTKNLSTEHIDLEAHEYVLEKEVLHAPVKSICAICVRKNAMTRMAFLSRYPQSTAELIEGGINDLIQQQDQEVIEGVVVRMLDKFCAHNEAVPPHKRVVVMYGSVWAHAITAKESILKKGDVAIHNVETVQNFREIYGWLQSAAKWFGSIHEM